MNKPFIIKKINECKQNGERNLNLCYLELRKIPKEVFELLMINKIILDDNHIKKIAKHILKLKNLYMINLEKNQISHINQKIFNKLNIKFVWLDHNLFKKIPLIQSIVLNFSFIRFSINFNQIDKFNLKLYRTYHYNIYYKIVITILYIQHMYKTYHFLLNFYSVY